MDARDASPVAETICLTLYRLALPVKLKSMKLTCSRDKSAMSRSCQEVMLLSQEWSNILHWGHTSSTRAELEQYAQVVADQGGSSLPFMTVMFVGFTTRTLANDRCTMVINIFPALKLLIAPDGIIIHLSTAERGNVHDLTHYRASGLPDCRTSLSGERLAIYSDPVYLLGKHMLRSILPCPSFYSLPER